MSNFTFRQATEADYEATKLEVTEMTNKIYCADDQTEIRQLVETQKNLCARQVAARSYQVNRDGNNEFSVRERNLDSGFGWGMISGGSLDELETKLAAALQAVQNAKKQHDAQPIRNGMTATGEVFLIAE